MTATLTTLAGFFSTSSESIQALNGALPDGDLIADANGDLFGTTSVGGPDIVGTVFEIVKTAGGYASTPTTLATFNVDDGSEPLAGLLADANGDLFGTTRTGGGVFDGNVFEIAKTTGGYVTTPTTLVSFNGDDGGLPEGSLIADSKGDLFGTASNGGANGAGAVFEIAKTAGGYASTPTTLVSFNVYDGMEPSAGLLADASGDLFGTTRTGGAFGAGTVFEIAKTPTGYASTPTTLVSFDAFVDGSLPVGSLIADSHGDLFGTTTAGGPLGGGTVFEIVKTPTGFASTPTMLASNLGSPAGSLIADANGDLFGTDSEGGANDLGTVFEIKKTAVGYAST